MDVSEFLDEYSSHLILLIIYVVLNGFMIYLAAWIKNRWLPEVGKEQVLLFNIQSYQQLGIKASRLRQEAFHLITSTVNVHNSLRQDGRSNMQIWEKLLEQYNPDKVFFEINSLKKDFSYLPAKMIDTIKELEHLLLQMFRELNFDQFKQAERVIELTDKLSNQIRDHTIDIMKRNKNNFELLVEKPKGGYASKSEIEAAKALAGKFESNIINIVNEKD